MVERTVFEAVLTLAYLDLLAHNLMTLSSDVQMIVFRISHDAACNFIGYIQNQSYLRQREAARERKRERERERERETIYGEMYRCTKSACSVLLSWVYFFGPNC